MKNTTIYGVGALVIIAGAGFLYFKNKKTTSLLETALPSNAGTSTVATTSPTKPPLSSTINPSTPLTALDLNIAALPGATTLAEIQPLIQQQQIANAQSEIQKQHQAEELAKQIRLYSSPCITTSMNTAMNLICTTKKAKAESLKNELRFLGYSYQNGIAVKL